jgi:hypothetical protein
MAGIGPGSRETAEAGRELALRIAAFLSGLEEMALLPIR